MKPVDAETKAEGMGSLKRLPEASLSADDSKMLSGHFLMVCFCMEMPVLLLNKKYYYLPNNQVENITSFC